MSHLERLPPLVGGVARAGAVLFGLVYLALFLGAGTTFVDSLLLASLLVALPAISIAQLPLAETTWIQRLPAYWSSIGTLGVVGAACWWAGTRVGGPAAVGLTPIAPWPLVAWSVGLTAAGLGVIVLFRGLSLHFGIGEGPLLRHLLPRSPREKAVFALLSVTAGACEELAFRGYAIPMLAPALGLPGAVVVTSLVFGVVHGYQGPLGVLRTGVMGAVLAGGFLAAGSLWPAVLAHALIDLIAGIALGEKLLPPERGAGVQEGGHPRSTGT